MNVVLQDWHSALPAPWATVGLVLTALAGGALVGWERERSEKPAGLRTMILVSVGAAVFTMLSRALAGPDADGSRIAAQVVTGVGGMRELRVRYCNAHKHHKEFLARLAAVPEVREIRHEARL